MKSFVVLAVVAMIAAASSGQVGNRNLITDIIKKIIENNRGKLANLSIEKIDLEKFGSCNNLLVNGAENFVLEKLDSAGPLSVDISNATVTLATASAGASLDLHNVEIPEIGLIVNGIGDVTSAIYGLFATVKGNFKLNGLKPVLVDFTDLYIHIDALIATITGVENVDSVNEIVNSKLAGFLNENLVKIAEANKQAIIDAVNKLLDGIAKE